MLSIITAHCSIESISPYCQSRYHAESYLEGESPDDYDLRTWRKHMHVKNISDNTVIEQLSVVIPARALHDCLVDGAKYSKRQIPNQGRATWTQKFASGIAILDDIPLGIDPDKVDYVPVFCNSDGKRGSGSRVLRRFPILPVWKAEFDVSILDPIIVEDVFGDMLEQAGMYIGIGQNRPQNRGVHGRFRVLNVAWLGAAQPDQRRKMRAA